MTELRNHNNLGHAAVLQEFQALREEMRDTINARLWGTLTYVAIAGGVGAALDSMNDPSLLVLLIFAAVPLHWHTVSRERARVRIGAYIQYMIEPNVKGLAWESHLSVWRHEIEGSSWKRVLSHWRHILGLTGVYIVIAIFSLYMLLRTGKLVPILLGAIGVLLCLHALFLFRQVYREAAGYGEIFRAAHLSAEVVRDNDAT